MALQDLFKPLPWPGHYPPGSTSIAFTTTQAATASGHYDAVICCASRAMTISHVAFVPQAASGSAVAEIRIETVDATTGLPTGTLWGTNTNGTSGTLAANTVELVALTASATIAKGDVFAVMVKYSSGTSFNPGRFSAVGTSGNLPYVATSTGTPATATGTPRARAIGNSSTTFYPTQGLIPAKSIGGGAFNNTNSAKRALRFKVPFKCRAVGISMYISTGTGDFNVAMLDDSGTDLGSTNKAYDGNKLANAASPTDLFFASGAILSPGVWYRASVEPSSATNVTFSTFVLPSAAYATGMPGGSNCHYATFASGSWTDTATDQVPILDILLDQLDDGVNVSGGAAQLMSGLAR